MYADLNVERKFKNDYGISKILKLVGKATSVATIADLSIWNSVRNVTTVATIADKRPPKTSSAGQSSFGRNVLNFLCIKFAGSYILRLS